MNILLIATNTRAQAEPSLGIGYLASYLKKYYPGTDLNIKLMNYMPKDISNILEFSPDIVGLSVLTKQYQPAIEFTRQLKARLNVPVVLGGHHISMAPLSFDPIFDLAVLGEGEQTFLELSQCLEHKKFNQRSLKSINGLLYLDDGDAVTTQSRSLIEPLDQFRILHEICIIWISCWGLTRMCLVNHSVEVLIFLHLEVAHFTVYFAPQVHSG